MCWWPQPSNFHQRDHHWADDASESRCLVPSSITSVHPGKGVGAERSLLLLVWGGCLLLWAAAKRSLLLRLQRQKLDLIPSYPIISSLCCMIMDLFKEMGEGESAVWLGDDFNAKVLYQSMGAVWSSDCGESC